MTKFHLQATNMCSTSKIPCNQRAGTIFHLGDFHNSVQDLFVIVVTLADNSLTNRDDLR